MSDFMMSQQPDCSHVTRHDLMVRLKVTLYFNCIWYQPDEHQRSHVNYTEQRWGLQPADSDSCDSGGREGDKLD